MPLPLKSKILETPGSLVKDDIKGAQVLDFDVLDFNDFLS
jgi:hypothetical protein